MRSNRKLLKYILKRIIFIKQDSMQFHKVQYAPDWWNTRCVYETASTSNSGFSSRRYLRVYSEWQIIARLLRISRRMFDNWRDFAQQNFDHCDFIDWKNCVVLSMRNLTKRFAATVSFQLLLFIPHKRFIHIYPILHNNAYSWTIVPLWIAMQKCSLHTLIRILMKNAVNLISRNIC